MCGICGIWGGSDNRQAVSAMVGALHHRGPDDRGILNKPGATLGMTRLAIIDTSFAGHQPMQTPDGRISLVYNGELYNFRSERRLLETQGYKFTSSSDTEVVLRMYEHYGDDFLVRMRGMFALAIYDQRPGPQRERLLLARDQMGIKPLVYAQIGGRLIFGSEIKAMLASGLVQPEIDPVSLRLLLTYGSVYQPRTILRDVQMLLPAHRMIVAGGRQRIERYWSVGIDRREGLRKLPYHEQVEEVAGVLEESVGLQMISDVPLGAFLSGGVDSSLLVAMMARQAGGKRVRTFSVGFEAEGNHIDETDAAERTARFIGTAHTRVEVRGVDVRDRIRHIAYGLDQPSVNGVNSYFVSLAARQGVTVAISGTGGDELFAGYPWFIKMELEARQNGRPSWAAAARGRAIALAQRPAFDWVLSLPRGGWRLANLRERSGFRSKYGVTNTIFGTSGSTQLIAPGLRHAAQAGRSLHCDLAHIDELSGGTAIERTSGLCLRGYTTNQLLRDIDAVSMIHSLEVRVPYLDPVVADVALSLPDDAKLGSLSGFSGCGDATGNTYRATGAKRILLDIGRKLLPPDFDLQPKRGFGMPFSEWLRGPLREVLEETLSKKQTQQRGLLDVNAVTAIKDGFLNGSIEWYQPWLLMMLELWSREVLDRSPQLPTPCATEWGLNNTVETGSAERA